MHVGVAEWKTARKPDALKTTLGSCVGVVLYAPRAATGGLAHVLLGEAPTGKIVKKGKYARPAILGLVAELKDQGVPTEDLRARVFGGASMFNAGQATFLQQIGAENLRIVRQVLKELKITLVSEDTGGSAGRTITLFLDDGRVLLRANGRERFIYKT
ncbi:MAG: chemotaxis protein CheD [Spirochaetales bacterium]|nr:chemotaxis protein CheD [Leptospiraceae bacterium]MCP5481690.1 chemotaxis protein CheD [Spirochaetales bacterium]